VTRSYTRVGAYALVAEQNRVLLVQVAPGNLDEGIWTLPGGGVGFGEHPDDALRRELYEEAGMRARRAEPLGADSRRLLATRRPGAPDVHWVRIYYQVEVEPGTPSVVEVGGSVSDVAWHPLDGLPDLAELAAVAMSRAGLL
jgi:8-oxo-dGTP diphosphatase